MDTNIAAILAKLRDLTLEDEDGNSLTLILNAGLSKHELEEYEAQLCTPLPEEFRAVLRYANGMNFFGQKLLSTHEQTFFPEQGIVTFHNWGNGDFDCVVVGASAYSVGAIAFMNHNPDVTTEISPTLSNWFDRAAAEIAKKGTLLHPADYRQRREQGLYGHVLSALRGRSCELNG